MPKRKRREEFASEPSSPAPPPLPGPAFRLRIALLLLASGGCALVYEVVWLRDLRLVFGTTTAATGTTLAIFLGGLGIGGLLLGRRADRAPDPLRLYARLELGVALGALASLPLIALARAVYLATGGASALGPITATALRIGLCALVLGPPTFLMGGTLPAAVRVLEHAADRSRRTVGLLYGVNTLGAVLGASWATFVSLEQWGTALTLLGAGAVNLIVAGVAFALTTQHAGGRAQRRQEARARGREAARPSPQAADTTPSTPAAPVWLVLGASGAVGAAFLAMELVWYRMLAPILGGSTYTIGLILALALLGIGAGGLLYAAGRTERRPTLFAFTVTCLLEAFFIALPYALGDRVALFAMDSRTWAGSSLPALVATWAAVTAVVVLPAAVVAGYQFPLLIALLGTREHAVGREVGWAYATNTAGAITGSLAAGFGLMPLLTAPGLWRAVVYLLLGLAAVSAAGALRRTRPARWLALAAVLGVLDVVLCAADGPTAFWRHTAIGAGGVETAPGPNGLRRLLNSKRGGILWEAEGKESSIALDRFDAYTLVVNGKSDGNALGDAPTQVMGGLMGALLHPELKRALVIGLGTGSTAGWLAALPTIERVDVLELEPAVLHVAEECGPVNQNVLRNPKVRIILGDGREFLLTTPERYDLIFSEPSNPYRAGVASLFTREFYRAAAARLRPGGVFVQWLQAYEIEPRSVAAVYATLGAVFPAVETWEMIVEGDLLMTAGLEPRTHDLAALRARLTTEPFRSALERIWGVSGIEGLYSAYVANAAFAADLARDSGRINTDDRTFLEFEFARSVGQETAFTIQGLRAAAAGRNQDRPQMTGTVDWERLQELRGIRVLRGRRVPEGFEPADPAGRERALARQAYATGKFGEARRHWLAQGGGAQAPMDLTVLADIFAGLADATARRSIDALRPQQPAEAEALAARERYEAGDKAAATRHLIGAFERYRRDPWAYRPVLARALQLASRIASEEPAQRDALFEALTPPFAVRALDLLRLSTRATIGLQDGAGHLCGAALAPLEPHVLWDRDFLQMRADCYGRTGSPLAARARADLDAFRGAAAAGEKELGTRGTGLPAR